MMLKAPDNQPLQSPFDGSVCSPWKELRNGIVDEFILDNLYLEDHPRTCKWLITMVIVSPLNGVVPL